MRGAISSFPVRSLRSHHAMSTLHSLFLPFPVLTSQARAGSYTPTEVRFVCVRQGGTAPGRAFTGTRHSEDMSISGRWALERDPSGQSGAGGEFAIAHEDSERRFAPSYDVLRLKLYFVMERLATGGFGTVSCVQRITDGKVLVWKELNYSRMNKKERRMMITEVNILREIEHKHVVKYYDTVIVKEQQKIFIIIQHCPHGDVGAMIELYKRRKKRMDEGFLWQVCTGTRTMRAARGHSSCPSFSTRTHPPALPPSTAHRPLAARHRSSSRSCWRCSRATRSSPHLVWLPNPRNQTMSGCVNQTMSSCVGLCGVLTSWSLNASPRHQREEVILHRDLKPANILLDDKYDVKARAPPGPPPVNPARTALVKTATVLTPPVLTRTDHPLF
jgi:serine/threonine protein kinase